MFTNHYININQLRIHYLEYGNDHSPNKPVLIYLHALTGNAHDFDYVAELFAENYRILSVDVRGRGDSDWGPADQYTLPYCLSDFCQLIEQLNISTMTLFGSSMGGVISMAYAGSYPEKVSKLILNDIGPEIDPTGVKRISAYVSNAPTLFNTMQEVIDYYFTISPYLKSLPLATVESRVQWSVVPTKDNKLTWKMDPAIRAPASAPNTESVQEHVQPPANTPSLWEFYKKITAPILVFRGVTSDILSLDTIRKMQQVHAQTEFVEVPNVGHLPLLSEPEVILALKGFIGS